MKENTEEKWKSTEPVIDRDPGLDFAAGEVGTVNNNELNGGAPLGKDHHKSTFKDLNAFEKSESGLVTTKKKNPFEQIQAIFQKEFLEHDHKSWHETIQQGWIEINVFTLAMPATAYTDSRGRVQLNHIIYPIAKVIQTSGMESRYNKNDLVRIQSSIMEFGPNPEWNSWAERRKSSDAVAAAERGDMAMAIGWEPPRYWGQIMEWTIEYGIADSIFDAYSNFNTRFLVPESFIRGKLNKAYVLEHLQSLVDENNKAEI